MCSAFPPCKQRYVSYSFDKNSSSDIVLSFFNQKDSLQEKSSNRRNSLPGQRVVCRVTEDRYCLFLFLFLLFIM